MPNPLLPAEQAWLVTLPSPPSAGGAMDASRVYVPLQSKTLAALDRQTGAPVWTVDVDTALAPVVAGDVLFVSVVDGVSALDASTGAIRWQAPFDQQLIAGLTYSTDWLVGVSEPGDLVAFRASDGAVLWRRPLGAPTRFAPVTDGARAVAALTDGRVVAMSLSNGEMLWERSLPGTLSQPMMTSNRVFVGSDTNDFYALSTESGEIRWRWRAGGDVIGAVTDAEGRVFFASLDNLIRGLNQGNGNQRWRKEIPSRPASPPLMAGDVVLISSIAPTITGYSTVAGAAAGTYAAPGELQGPPLLDPVLRPFRVAMVTVTRDGRVAGVIPTAMLFREPMIAPLLQFPGVRLGREPVPVAR